MNRVWWIALGVLAVAVIFQLFFRYEYVRSGPYNVAYRVDRLTGATCLFPAGCNSTPTPYKTTPTNPFDTVPVATPNPCATAKGLDKLRCENPHAPAPKTKIIWDTPTPR